MGKFAEICKRGTCIGKFAGICQNGSPLELEIFVAKDKTLQERIDNVCTAKGMGFISAVGIVAETDGFALFKSRNQLVSYAGYDVKEHESGTSVKGKPRISKKGNSNIRRIT